MSTVRYSPGQTGRWNRTRARPRPTQFDYLYLRRLARALATAIDDAPGPINDVLDVFCGSKPYAHLLPSHARHVGLDIADPYGVVDVVSDQFLPFPDLSFDFILSTESFYYLRDPAHAVAEMARVLRPGGWVLITVPVVWEYSRSYPEARYTGPGLARLFEGWEDVQVVELGGRGVVWAMVTGRLVQGAEQRAPRALRPFTWPLFTCLYLAMNTVGAAMEALERRMLSDVVLPMGVLLTARRPPS